MHATMYTGRNRPIVVHSCGIVYKVSKPGAYTVEVEEHVFSYLFNFLCHVRKKIGDITSI